MTSFMYRKLYTGPGVLSVMFECFALLFGQLHTSKERGFLENILSPPTDNKEEELCCCFERYLGTHAVVDIVVFLPVLCHHIVLA